MNKLENLQYSADQIGKFKIPFFLLCYLHLLLTQQKKKWKRDQVRKSVEDGFIEKWRNS